MGFYFMENICCTYYLTQSLGSWWYLPFESHRMQLVELFDNLLISLKMTLNLEFPLGWTNHCPWWLFALKTVTRCSVILTKGNSRLDLSPSCRMIVIQWSQCRNTLIGQAECAKWGKIYSKSVTSDTFGNMGQAPQILQKSKAFTWRRFGRGVKPIGFKQPSPRR